MRAWVKCFGKLYNYSLDSRKYEMNSVNIFDSPYISYGVRRPATNAVAIQLSATNVVATIFTYKRISRSTFSNWIIEYKISTIEKKNEDDDSYQYYAKYYQSFENNNVFQYESSASLLTTTQWFSSHTIKLFNYLNLITII